MRVRPSAAARRRALGSRPSASAPAEHDITSDIELIRIQDVNTAYDRLLKGDVKYRFVIDVASLRQEGAA